MNRKILTVASLTLILDQISKVLIEAILELNAEIQVIPNFFSLHYINNYGAAWSIMDNQTPLIITISLIALVIIYRFMYAFKTNQRNNIAFGLMVGGLIGNLIDRWLFGYVRDFFDFRILQYDYPIFNIADIAIVIGVILLFYAILKGEDHHEDSSRTK